MNYNILIYCDFLTEEDVLPYTKIPFVDEDMYQGEYANTGDLKLLGVHFPFEIVEKILVGYTYNYNSLKIEGGIKINVYINSPYTHDIVLSENGPWVKERYPLVMSLFRLGVCKGPLKMGPVTVWEVSSNDVQIQIISVYSYETDKLKVEL
mgnify:CR=1 FL=1|tara:strand:- start:5228 stop:5680 length:453 start_codon:yes stop_codon:yes gene_type:complete